MNYNLDRKQWYNYKFETFTSINTKDNTKEKPSNNMYNVYLIYLFTSVQSKPPISNVLHVPSPSHIKNAVSFASIDEDSHPDKIQKS